MERYARYREQIKRMAPEQFAAAKGKSVPTPADSEDFSTPFGDLVASAESRSHSAPYMLYLKRRRRFLVAKFVALGIVVVGFIVWWFLLQGRK